MQLGYRNDRAQLKIGLQATIHQRSGEKGTIRRGDVF